MSHKLAIFGSIQNPDFIQFLGPKMHKKLIFWASKLLKNYFAAKFFADFFMSQKVGIFPIVMGLESNR